MTSNRDTKERGAAHRAVRDPREGAELERRRAEMQEQEGHAGSVPRGNQQLEREVMGTHRIEWDRVLGH